MNEIKSNPERRIALFQRKEIRRVIHNNEWWFVIADVVSTLTDSADPQGYIKDMRRRDNELHKRCGQIAIPLAVLTSGGSQKLNCANTEGLFRLIQSIPSPKAEPFKRWLARIGYERIQEIEDPDETAYLLKSPANARRLLTATRQLEDGKGKRRKLKLAV